MKIIVVGTGYVGLVTGTCLSEMGMQVTCIDIDQHKIDQLNRGQMPIYEPGLEELVLQNVQQGRLVFDTRLKDHLPGADVVFIAVGTPQSEDGSADLHYVLDVAKEIGTYMEHHLVVVTKSTVPVGSSLKIKESVVAAQQAAGKSIPFDIAANPEFLKEGAAIADFMSPDRIVVGTENEKARAILERVYKPFLLNGFRIIFMDIASAELTKYAANAMLATRISFMNDIANLCEQVGADIHQVRQGIGTDPRIGNKFLYSGIGYRGACFPKDVKALMKTGKDNGLPLRLLEVVEAINQDQKKLLFKKLQDIFAQDLRGKRIAIWGLSFKPQTDDMREAPSLDIIQSLLSAGAVVSAYDPVAMEEARKYLPSGVTYGSDAYAILKEADALLLLTEWRMFRSPDWERVRNNMNNLLILDGRSIYNALQLREMGFTYYGVGIP